MAKEKKINKKSDSIIEVTFTFSLDRHTGFPGPDVVVFLDLNSNNRDDKGEEVVMIQKENDLTWEGSILVKKSRTVGLRYFMSAIGSLGAKWTMVVKSNRPKDHVINKMSEKIQRVPVGFSDILMD
ncbi:MAG: hypothetical protein JXI43_07460 [Tissierellales bacterium]|nr:hypothetical protein [Tissierellales bacterium]